MVQEYYAPSNSDFKWYGLVEKRKEEARCPNTQLTSRRRRALQDDDMSVSDAHARAHIDSAGTHTPQRVGERKTAGTEIERRCTSTRPGTASGAATAAAYPNSESRAPVGVTEAENSNCT